jgi:MAF protein
VDIDESQLDGESPRDYVQRLAQKKADAAARKLSPGDIVIAADTTVADGDEILGKPSSPQEAQWMLQRLRGRMHQVFTAISVFDVGSTLRLADLCRTDVLMRTYSQQEISAYVASGDPLDKAGAYAIQHRGFDPVEKIEGCYANVVGLPLCHLVRLLREFDIYPLTNITQDCQESLHYTCPIRDMVLQEK